jgi:uncharacterized protein GlcG (DUF336 family)
MSSRWIALLALTAMPAVGEAQSVLSDQLATRIIEGCVAHAKAKRQSHAVAVHDAGAAPIAVLRMDGNPPGVMAFAMKKAEAVANWRFATAEMGNAVKDTPGFAAAPHVVTVGGGVPIFSADGQVFLGAVGVSGESPADDASCAEAGVRAAGLSISRRPR